MKTKYVCEYCGQEYDLEEDAVKCETSHINMASHYKVIAKCVGRDSEGKVIEFLMIDDTLGYAPDNRLYFKQISESEFYTEKF